jgi:hypothetical protein
MDRTHGEAHIFQATAQFKAIRQDTESPGFGSYLGGVISLDAIDLLHKLVEIGFFDGYDSNAQREAEVRIVKQLDAGNNGSLKKLFQKYPGISLIFLEYDGEWDFDPFGHLEKLEPGIS